MPAGNIDLRESEPAGPAAVLDPAARPAHVRDRLTERVVPFTASDGMQLHLVNVRGPRAPTRCPVLLAHGAGMRTDVWLRAPIATSLVDVLVESGYDVWLENWRASMYAGANPWTLDKAAVHDHPAAVRAVVDDTGATSIKAIVQCMGSASFAMSAVAGLVPEVSTIVSNSVSLHPVVPRIAELKGRFVRPVIGRLTDYFNPRWGVEAETAVARAAALYVRSTRRECDNAVCRMASFIYGSGRPTLWRHENLNEETHDWLKGEFGPAPAGFFDQIARCIQAGRLVPVDGFPELPADLASQPPRTDARWAFLAGALNDCFLPVGQRRSWEFLDRRAPGRHAFHLLDGYGHLDVFIGRNAFRDTYPVILDELSRS